MGSLVKLIIFVCCLIVLCWVFLFFVVGDLGAKEKESYYQGLICSELQGKQEYALLDRTRVDCLTATEAIEVDFQTKWAECIGQALFYSEMTNLKPVCYLIVDSNAQRYIDRFNLAIKTICPKIELRTIGE